MDGFSKGKCSCKIVIKTVDGLVAEVESRTQGSRPRPRTPKKSRPRTAFPRTEPLEAKDQGHRRKRSPKKVSKIFFQAISNSLAYPEFLIGGGLNHKSYDMTSSKFFQTGSFCGTKISLDGRSEIVIACLHITRILQRKRAYTIN